MSLRREKCIEYGGPDGGNGGKGGDVWGECVDGLYSLIDYRYQQHFRAERGGHGMGRQRSGAGASDVILKVPKGTQIFAEDEETLICDMTEVGQRVMLAKGGDGGFGNEHRSEEHTSELQSLMRISYAVFCLNKKMIHVNTD